MPVCISLKAPLVDNGMLEPLNLSSYRNLWNHELCIDVCDLRMNKLYSALE